VFGKIFAQQFSNGTEIFFLFQNSQKKKRFYILFNSQKVISQLLPNMKVTLCERAPSPLRLRRPLSLFHFTYLWFRFQSCLSFGT